MNCNSLGLLTSPPQTYLSSFPNFFHRNSSNDFRQQSNNSSSVNDVTRQFAQLMVTGSGPVIPPYGKLSCRPFSNHIQGNCYKPSSGPTKCAYDHKLFHVITLWRTELFWPNGSPMILVSVGALALKQQWRSWKQVEISNIMMLVVKKLSQMIMLYLITHCMSLRMIHLFYLVYYQ